MNKIYTSGNYIIVEVGGEIKPFPMGTSEYNEAIDHFILRKYPNKDVQIFSFLDISNGVWTDESGNGSYSIDSLRVLFRANTGKSSGGGVGVGNTGKLYKYTVDVFDDLSTITDAIEGDIARVYNSQGIWILGTLKSEGAYTYENGVWVYGSRSLQSEIIQNDADILLIQNTLPNKVDKEFLGWVQITDGQYTSTAPYAIEQGIRTKLTNNSDDVLNITNLFGATTLWNSATNRFENDNSGDSFNMRVQFVANTSLNNRNLTLALDIGGTQGVIWSKTIQLVRGAGTNNKITENIHFYTLGTFIANGGELYLTCDSDVNIFDVSFLIERSYRHG